MKKHGQCCQNAKIVCFVWSVFLSNGFNDLYSIKGIHVSIITRWWRWQGICWRYENLRLTMYTALANHDRPRHLNTTWTPTSSAWAEGKSAICRTPKWYVSIDEREFGQNWKKNTFNHVFSTNPTLNSWHSCTYIEMPIFVLTTPTLLRYMNI